MHFVGGGHDDAVACCPYLLQCTGNPVIFPLDLPHFPEMRHQCAIVGNVHAGFLTQHLIKQRFRENQADFHNAAARLDAADLHFLHACILRCTGKQPPGIPQMLRPSGPLQKALIQSGFQRMILRQRRDPARQIEVQLLHREFIEQLV